MNLILPLTFWFSLFFVLYTYIGYPFIIFILAFVMRRKPKKEKITPPVSFLIIAYNEEKFMEEKIKNCIALDYPKDKIEIVIVSSGSTDGTDNIILSYQHENIQFVKIEKNKGKAYAINYILPRLKNDIIVFSDARQMFEPNSVRNLVSNFSDESIGAVSGELILYHSKNKKEIKGVSVYWDYEKLLRKNESDVHSTLGTTGAIYAIRKKLFDRIDNDTILDDFVIPMNIVRKGYRVVFEENAIALDKISKSYQKEFNRKVRTLSGNYQAFSRMRYLFNPIKNKVFFQFVSHKVFRLLVPFFLVLILISNLFLGSFMYRIFLVFQVVIYFFALIGCKYSNGIFGIFSTFIVMNLAAVIGLYKFLTKPLDNLWK